MMSWRKQFVFLVLLPLILISQAGVATKDDLPLKLDQIRSAVRARLQLYRDDIATAILGHAPQRRSKRATITADNPLSSLPRTRRKINILKPDEGAWLANSWRQNPQFFDSIATLDIYPFKLHNQTFLASLTLDEVSKDPVLLLHRLKGLEESPVELARATIPGANSLQVVEIDGSAYILPLVPSSTLSSGSPLLRLDLLRRELVQVQIIPTPGAVTSIFWRGSGDEGANGVWLGVAPAQGVSRVDLYRWQGGYFDAVATVQASNPEAITHFTLLNNHFLGVANYMDQTGSTTIHSELFKYVHRDGSWTSFQRIRTFGAKDIKHFQFKADDGRMEHFLAVANHCVRDEAGVADYHVKSLIMKWGQHRFIPFKSFWTRGALQFLPFMWEDKFVLVLLEMDRLRLFQYNGWSFVQVKHIDLAPTAGLRHLHAFPSQPAFSLSSPLTSSLQGGFWALSFTHKNDHSALGEGLEKWCVGARKRLLEVDMANLARLVHSAPKVHDADVRLNNGSLTFKGRLNAKSVTTTTVTVRGVLLDDVLATKLASLEGDLDRQAVPQLADRVSNAVHRHHSATIGGSVTFSNVEYTSPSLSTDRASLGIWNGVDVAKVVGGLLLTHVPTSLNSLTGPELQFIGEREYENALDVTSLNGAPLTDYALKKTDPNTNAATFVRRVTFRGELELGGVSIVDTGLFAGVDFARANFILATGNQTFNSVVKVVGESSTTHLYTKYLNGKNISYYFDDAVSLEGNDVITANHVWNNVSVDRVQLNTVNGVDMQRLMSDAIRTRGKESQRMKGLTRFRHLDTPLVTLEQELVNGRHNLKKDFVSVVEGNYTFGEIVLSKGGSVEQMRIISKLGNLDPGENSDFGLLLKNSDSVQKVRSKNLGGIHFGHDVTAENLFAGVDIAKWSPNLRIKLRTNTLSRKVNIHGTLTTPTTKVTKSLAHNTSGLSSPHKELLPLLSYAAEKNGTKLPGSCLLTFDSLKVDGDTGQVREVNGLKPGDWLLRNATKVTLTGTKVFLGDVILDGDVSVKSLHGKIGGEDILSILPDLMLHGANQTVHGPTIFTEMLLAGRVDCPSTSLAGVPFATLLTRKGDQLITTPTSFDSLVGVRESLNVSTDLVFHSLDGRDFGGDVADTLRTFSPSPAGQVVQGEFAFDAGLTVTQLLLQQHKTKEVLVNEVDLHELLTSLVRRDRKTPLEFHASSTSTPSQLQFLSGLTVSALSLTNNSTLDQMPASDWGKSWLLSSSNQTIVTMVHAMDGILVDGAENDGGGVWTTNGKVGDVDVVSLARNTLRRDEGGHLRRAHLSGGGSIESVVMGREGTLNGARVDTDLVVRSKPNRITGSKTFSASNPFHISGNLDTRLLSGADVSSALRFLYDPSSASFAPHKLKIVGNLALNREPEARRSVNGQDWSTLLKSVWFKNVPAKLRHKVSFGRVVFSGGARLQNGSTTLSGIRLDHLQDRVASKTRSQVWTGKVVLAGPVTMNHLEVDEVTGSYPKLNGVSDLSHFLSSLLTNGTNQTVHANWKLDTFSVNNLVHKGGLNGANLDHDFVTLHGQNVMINSGSGGDVTLNSLTAHEIVLPHKTGINGVNLTAWRDQALKADTNIAFDRPLILDSITKGKHLRTKSGLVDGVPVANLLLKSTPQTIHGRFTLTNGDLFAPRGIHLKSGPLNEHELKDTLDTLLLKNGTGPAVVLGPVRFTSPVSAVHLTVGEGVSFQGQNLSDLLAHYYSGSVIPPALHFKSRASYDSLNTLTDNAIVFAGRRAAWVEYWKLTQIVEGAQFTYVKVLLTTTAPTLLLGSGGQIGSQTEWEFAVKEDLYRKVGMGSDVSIRVKGGNVSRVVELDGGMLAMAISAQRQISLSHVTRAVNYTDVFKGSGHSQVLILHRSEVTATWVLQSTIYGKDFGLLETIGECLFVSPTTSGGEIMCGSPLAQFQTLPLSYPTLVTSVDLGYKPVSSLLMILTWTTKREDGLIEVWRQPQPNSYFVKESCIPVFNAVSIDSGRGPNHHTFLAVASAPSPTKNYQGAVFLYRYDETTGEFEKTQTLLNVGWVLEVRFLLVGGASKELFLFALTRATYLNVIVFKFHGVSGWSREHDWTSPGAVGLETVSFSSTGLHRAQVILWGRNETRIYSALFKGLPHDEEEYDDDGESYQEL